MIGFCSWWNLNIHVESPFRGVFSSWVIAYIYLNMQLKSLLKSLKSWQGDASLGYLAFGWFWSGDRLGSHIQLIKHKARQHQLMPQLILLSTKLTQSRV